MKNRILVTGAGGYIGSQLLQRFQQKGMDCWGVEKTPSPDPQVKCFDLQDWSKTAQCLNPLPDIVFHLATHSALAYQNSHSNCIREDEQVLSNILLNLRRTGCRLVYFSTSYVYSGLPIDRDVTEDNRLKPTHPFGKAKLDFERWILEEHPENSVIFRLFSVFGPGNYLFPNTVHQMVKECQETDRITVWGGGKRKMQYVYLPDVLDCCEKVFSLPAGVYNVCGNRYLTIQKTAEIIAKMFNGVVDPLWEKREGETLPFGINRKIVEACNVAFTPFEQALEAYRQ